MLQFVNLCRFAEYEEKYYETSNTYSTKACKLIPFTKSSCFITTSERPMSFTDIFVLFVSFVRKSVEDWNEKIIHGFFAVVECQNTHLV